MEPQELRDRIAADMPRVVEELARLVRIPSIGHPGHDPANVRASAEATRDILTGAGLADTRLLELEGGHPAAFGRSAGPDRGPSLLLYAHHDVQPEGPVDEWTSPPFEPVVRDGRMYGRGAADDKSGVVIHAAALRALGLHEGAEPPVTVKVLVEGEEECTTAHLPDLVRGNADLLRADVAVVGDGGNYRNGLPTLGTSIRGVTDCIVTVRVLPQAQHSGTYGGPIPDALTILCRMLATLHDDDGNVAIPGLRRFGWTGTQVSEEELRGESGMLPSVRMIGTGSISERLLSAPAVSVLGIDAPSVDESSNQLVPWARARVSLRLAPGDDAEAARDLLGTFLRDAEPWGAEVEISANEAGMGYIVDTTTPAYHAATAALAEAYGRDVVDMGSGGSIPLVPMLAETFPGIAVLIWGAMDERSYIHSVNESVDLEEIERIALAEAMFIQNLAPTA
jgi:acetylornithine deacetylase/succinyl-diaminopimelate desuccinylase-like protein